MSTPAAPEGGAGAAGAPRPVTVLLAALGGEGGGVLTSWIVNAAQAADLPVQATSIPGVAQRTGATTYYIEIWPQPWSALNGRAPVLALSPAPGEVDVMAATELLEAGRAVRAGYVTPERTLLVASTHRVYTTDEKMQMGDGRFDAEELRRGAEARAQRPLLVDLARTAREADAPLNAVLLGVLAGCGRLPLPEDAFREGIRTEGKAAEINLRGFECGLALARGPADAGPADAGAARPAPMRADTPLARAREEFPAGVHMVLEHSVRRLTDYQDAAYAALYLERLAPFREAEPALLEAVTRHLAVRMSYEDAIRVAQAKTRPERLARIRAETGAAPGEPVAITEFLKPGLEEFCDILPAPLARTLLALGERWPWLGRARRGMTVRTSTVAGFLKLRMLVALRRTRRLSWRYRHEQEAIGAWLALVEQAATHDARLAREVAECARLIKGYGDTLKRGTGSYARIEAALIRPALEAARNAPATPEAAERIAAAREAALADPEGDALERLLAPAAAQAAPARSA